MLLTESNKVAKASFSLPQDVKKAANDLLAPKISKNGTYFPLEISIDFGQCPYYPFALRFFMILDMKEYYPLAGKVYVQSTRLILANARSAFHLITGFLRFAHLARSQLAGAFGVLSGQSDLLVVSLLQQLAHWTNRASIWVLHHKSSAM